MPNRKNNYRDMEKFKKTRNAQKQRYYNQTAIYKPSHWTFEQDMMVLEHTIPDSELSSIIKHSVRAIQHRRCRLKKAIKEEVGIPVKFVGLGEGDDDLESFDIEKYVYGLFKDL